MKQESTKVRFLSMLFVLTVLLGSVAIAPAQAHAQDGGFSIMLPIAQTGAPIAQPVDGPFADVELPTFDDIVADRNVGLTEVESGGEITAAGRCYDNLQTNTWRNASGWTRYYYHSTTANCYDLNVKITSSSPQCQVVVFSYWYDGQRWNQGSRSHVEITPNQWYEPIIGLYDNVPTATAFWTNGQCGIYNIKIAS